MGLRVVSGHYRGVAFRFRRSVGVDVCGHLDRGAPEELLRQLQVSRLLVNDTRS